MVQVFIDEAKNWLLMRDVCARLNRKRPTVQQLLQSGKLKSTKIGQTYVVMEKDLQEFIKIWPNRNFKSYPSEANPVALLLLRFNLSYQDFARIIDCHPDYIRKLVNGKKKGKRGVPIPEKALKFFDEMGVNLELLKEKYDAFLESRGLK